MNKDMIEVKEIMKKERVEIGILKKRLRDER